MLQGSGLGHSQAWFIVLSPVDLTETVGYLPSVSADKTCPRRVCGCSDPLISAEHLAPQLLFTRFIDVSSPTHAF